VLVGGQDRLKHSRAQAVVQRTGVVESTQVINETCVNLLKKARLAEAEIQRLIASFYTEYEVVPTERVAMHQASQLRELRADRDTVWLSQLEMAELFSTSKTEYFTKSEEYH
jgi:predicted nucleic acid-binding protein